MKTEKQIFYNDENAARFVENIKGWIDVNNRFFGNDKDSEHLARYSSSTHKHCECGAVIDKHSGMCKDCYEKKDKEKYYSLEFREYKGEMVYSHLADQYFNDSGEIEDYCHNEGVDFNDLMLVFCRPKYYQSIDVDYWDDDIIEGFDYDNLPKELLAALDIFNESISKLEPAYYYPDLIRTDYKRV